MSTLINQKDISDFERMETEWLEEENILPAPDSDISEPTLLVDEIELSAVEDSEVLTIKTTVALLLSDPVVDSATDAFKLPNAAITSEALTLLEKIAA